MKKIKEYKTIKSTYSPILDSLINEALSEGWELYGQGYAIPEACACSYQAMVKYEEETKPDNKYEKFKSSILKIIDNIPEFIISHRAFIEAIYKINDLCTEVDKVEEVKSASNTKDKEAENRRNIDNKLDTTISDLNFLSWQENRDDNKPKNHKEVVIKFRNTADVTYKFSTDKWEGKDWLFNYNNSIEKWAYIPE